MDPITVVGFVAAIVQLIDTTSKVINYFNTMKNAPKDRAKLVREAYSLLALLADLRYQVEENNSSTNSWFTGLQSLGEKGGLLMQFKNAMEDIANMLAPTTDFARLRRVVRWTSDKREIDAILSKIERLKSLISLALQKDHIKLSLAMREEVAVGFKDMKTNRDVEKIKIWLAAPLPSSNHNTAIEKKQPCTGEWFIQSKEFAEWKMGTSSFIWLNGIPGCGKTILCSTVIQDVICSCQSEPKTAVAYFYFDFNDLHKQRTEMLIRSLIVQLMTQCPHLPESLQSAHSRSQDGQKQPTTDEMKIILRQMLEKFDATYILLDALDECTDRENLLKSMEVLMGWNISTLHVLVTSRKEHNIAIALEPLTTCQLCIQSALVDADIRVHILDKLSNDPRLKKWPVDVQKEIEDALMRGADGMFRWVVCQLDSLQKCLKLDALRKALNALPKTLDDTYERILSNLDEEYEEDALKLFQWLCFSLRPMRLEELVEVLAVDSTFDSRFRPEQRLPDPCDILTICSTLVNVTAAVIKNSPEETSGSQELKLAHLSVKEYLISDRLKKASMHRYHITPSSANLSIAKTCLGYLLYFESPLSLTKTSIDHEFSFIRYAARFWPKHYSYITNDTDRELVDVLGYNLVKSKNSCFINWLNLFTVYQSWKAKVNFRTHGCLYCMTFLGVSGVVQLLLNEERNIDAKSGKYNYLLKVASNKGHEKLVRLLLEKGANINAEDKKYDSALLAASREGHGVVVQLLLEKGANVNAGHGKYGNALLVASREGHEDVVQLLLEKGANVNAERGMYGNALSTASYNGHEKVVRLLLEKGTNVNAERGMYGIALSTASFRGHEEVVRLLLEKGADINADGGEYGNALSEASYNGHEKVVRLLLRKGANVNAEGGKYGIALSAASFRGHEEVVRLLLEKGADINADGREYGNALSAASSGGHEKMVQLLLENGASVNAEGGMYGNALSAASSQDYKKVVELLLDKGANINAEGGMYGNALSTASYHGHEKVVQLLLENRADVNSEGGENGNALSAASYHGHEKVVQLLLENGADVNAGDRENGNALSAASSQGYKKVVELLLKRADINAEGGKYGNALLAASREGHEDVVQLLLEKGADVNAKDYTGSNALSTASYCGYEKVVRLLLDKGADVNAKDYIGSNALLAASFQGHEKVVRLLLEKGASVNGQNGNALKLASQEGHEAVMRLLLKYKADVHLVFDYGSEGLQGTSVDDHEAVIQLLLREHCRFHESE